MSAEIVKSEKRKSGEVPTLSMRWPGSTLYGPNKHETVVPSFKQAEVFWGIPALNAVVLSEQIELEQPLRMGELWGKKPGLNKVDQVFTAIAENQILNSQAVPVIHDSEHNPKPLASVGSVSKEVKVFVPPTFNVEGKRVKLAPSDERLMKKVLGDAVETADRFTQLKILGQALQGVDSEGNRLYRANQILDPASGRMWNAQEIKESTKALAGRFERARLTTREIAKGNSKLARTIWQTHNSQILEQGETDTTPALTFVVPETTTDQLDDPHVWVLPADSEVAEMVRSRKRDASVYERGQISLGLQKALGVTVTMSMVLSACGVPTSIQSELQSTQDTENETESSEVVEMPTTIATLPSPTPTVPEAENKDMSLKIIGNDQLLNLHINSPSGEESVDLGKVFENLKESLDVSRWGENPEIYAIAYQVGNGDGTEDVIYPYISVVSEDDKVATFMVTSEEGNLDYQELERFVDDEGKIGLGYELPNGDWVTVFSSCLTKEELENLTEEDLLSLNLLFSPADKFVSPENLPKELTGKLKVLAAPVEAGPSSKELATEEAEAEARRKTTEKVLSELREEWREAGNKENGEIYSESLEVTGKSKTTELKANCANYYHLTICTDQQYVESELNYYPGWGTKHAGEMLMANPQIQESEEMVGRLGALVHATNIATQFPESGIDMDSPEWYEQFMNWLDKNPGVKYKVTASKPNSEGKTEAVTLGEVDPRLPFKVVYMMPKFNDERIEDRKFTGTSDNTPYDFWIRASEAFLQIEITPEGQFIVYDCGVSPNNWLWGDEKNGGDTNWAFLVGARRDMRTSSIYSGSGAVGTLWYENFWKDYKYGNIKPRSQYLEWVTPDK